MDNLRGDLFKGGQAMVVVVELGINGCIRRRIRWSHDAVWSVAGDRPDFGSLWDPAIAHREPETPLGRFSLIFSMFPS